jgi:uncharacterized membrane protein YsdA (DUF1294 family)/cold shock CspA family protein
MVPRFTGRIAQWDPAKGCGWIESDGQRIFLHRREFADRRKEIEAGDRVRFVAGVGPNGRTCAKQAVHVSGRIRLSVGALVMVGALLMLPAVALAKLPLPVEPVNVAVYLLAVNVVTFWTYARDKAKARPGEWRTPESTLHLLELGGGWPAAFLAQRALRHKCSKRSYQVIFWGIVLLYQAAAYDYLQGGRLTRAFAAALG